MFPGNPKYHEIKLCAETNRVCKVLVFGKINFFWGATSKNPDLLFFIRLPQRQCSKRTEINLFRIYLASAKSIDYDVLLSQAWS